MDQAMMIQQFLCKIKMIFIIVIFRKKKKIAN